MIVWWSEWWMVEFCVEIGGRKKILETTGNARCDKSQIPLLQKSEVRSDVS
jgi:hypothetical protein